MQNSTRFFEGLPEYSNYRFVLPGIYQPYVWEQNAITDDWRWGADVPGLRVKYPAKITHIQSRTRKGVQESLEIDFDQCAIVVSPLLRYCEINSPPLNSGVYMAASEGVFQIRWEIDRNGRKVAGKRVLIPENDPSVP